MNNTNPRHSEISALADSELDALAVDRVLDSLKDDPMAFRHWQSTALLSDYFTLRQAKHGRQQSSTWASMSFSSRVNETLKREVTRLAPSAARDIQAATTSRHHQSSSLWRRTAIAAGILLVISNINTLFGPSLEVKEIASSATDAIEVNDAQRANQSGLLFAKMNKADIEELELLLVKHGEFSSKAALNGLSAFAKVVNRQVVNYSH